MADENPTVTSRRDEARDEPSKKYPFTYYTPPPKAPEPARPLTQQDFRREKFETELAVPEVPWVNPAVEDYRQSAKNLAWMEKQFGPLFSGWQGLTDEEFDLSTSSMAYIPQERMGYSPSYWEDPYRVARNYQAINSMPPGAETPDWMNKDEITAAYNYFKAANKGKPWTEWKFLNEADPARGFLQQIGTPPDDMLLPKEVLYKAPPEEQIQQQADTLSFDETMANPNIPGWNKALYWIMGAGSPEGGFNWRAPLGPAIVIGAAALAGGVVGGLVGGGIGAIPGAILGGAKAAGFMYAFGLGAQGVMQGSGYAKGEFEEAGFTGLAETAGAVEQGTYLLFGVLNMFWEGTKRLAGVGVQAGLSVSDPDRYGPIDELFGSWAQAKGTWHAGFTLPMAVQEALVSTGLDKDREDVWQLGQEEQTRRPDLQLRQGGPILKAGANYGDVLRWYRNEIAAGAPPAYVQQLMYQWGGITTQMADLVGAVVLDPLNYGVPQKYANLALGKVADAKGNIPLAQAAAMGAEMRSGPVGTLRLYKHTLRTATPVEIISGGSWLQRYLGGVERTGEVQRTPTMRVGAEELDGIIPINEVPSRAQYDQERADSLDVKLVYNEQQEGIGGKTVKLNGDTTVEVGPNAKPGTASHEFAHVISEKIAQKRGYSDRYSLQQSPEYSNSRAGLRDVYLEHGRSDPYWDHVRTEEGLSYTEQGDEVLRWSVQELGRDPNSPASQAIGEAAPWLKPAYDELNLRDGFLRSHEETAASKAGVPKSSEEFIKEWLESPTNRTEIRQKNPEVATKLDELYPRGIPPNIRYAEGRGKVFQRKNGLLEHLFTLTPKSRAIKVVGITADVMKAAMTDVATFPDFIRRLRGLAETPVAMAEELSLRFIGTPDGEYFVLALKDFDFEKLSNHELIWTSSELSRNLLHKIAEVKGQKPWQVLEALGDPQQAGAFFQSLMQDITLRADAGDATAIQLIDAAKAGQLTEQTIKDFLKMFIDEQLPYTAEQAKAMVFMDWMDHVSKWSVERLGVKVEPLVWRLATLQKSIHSLLLLDVNPTYAINNGVNNFGTITIDGAFSLKNVGKALDYWERWGIYPYKLRQAFGGPADLGDLQSIMEHAAATEMGFLGVTQKAEAEATRGIAKAASGEGGIRVATDHLLNFRRKIGFASRASAKLEEWASVQAMTRGTQQFWSRAWRPGKGYRRMPTALEKLLGPDLSTLIYGHITDNLSMAEIRDGLVEGQYIQRSVSSFVDEIATALNMDPENVSEILHASGAQEFLQQNLPDAKSPAEVEGVFSMLRNKVQGHIDELQIQENITRTEASAAQIQSGDWMGFLDTWNDLNRKFDDWWMANSYKWTDTMERASTIKDHTHRNQLVASRMATAHTESSRMKSIWRATIDGIGVGLRRNGVDFPENYTSLLDDQFAFESDFFATRDFEWREFWRKTSSKELEFGSKDWKSEYVRISSQLDDAYGRLALETTHIQEAMDLGVVDMVARTQPELADSLATVLGDVRDHRMLMMAREQNIRRVRTRIRIAGKATRKEVATILKQEFGQSDPEFLQRIKPWLETLSSGEKIDSFELNNALYDQYVQNLKVPGIAELTRLRTQGIKEALFPQPSYADVVQPALREGPRAEQAEGVLGRIEPEQVEVDRSRVQELIDQGIPRTEAEQQAVQERMKLGVEPERPYKVYTPEEIHDIIRRIDDPDTLAQSGRKDMAEGKKPLGKVLDEKIDASTLVKLDQTPGKYIYDYLDDQQLAALHKALGVAAEDAESIVHFLDQAYRSRQGLPQEFEAVAQVDLGVMRELASRADISTATDAGRPMNAHLLAWINSRLQLKHSPNKITSLENITEAQYGRAMEALRVEADGIRALEVEAKDLGMTSDALKFLDRPDNFSRPAARRIAEANGLTERLTRHLGKEEIAAFLTAKREGRPYEGVITNWMTPDRARDLLDGFIPPDYPNRAEQIDVAMTVWEQIAKSKGMTLEDWLLSNIASGDDLATRALFQTNGIHPWRDIAIEFYGRTSDYREGFYLLDDGTFLDGSGRSQGSYARPGQRLLDHGEIGSVAFKQYDEPTWEIIYRDPDTKHIELVEEYVGHADIEEYARIDFEEPRFEGDTPYSELEGYELRFIDEFDEKRRPEMYGVEDLSFAGFSTNTGAIRWAASDDFVRMQIFRSPTRAQRNKVEDIIALHKPESLYVDIGAYEGVVNESLYDTWRHVEDLSISNPTLDDLERLWRKVDAHKAEGVLYQTPEAAGADPEFAKWFVPERVDPVLKDAQGRPRMLYQDTSRPPGEMVFDIPETSYAYDPAEGYKLVKNGAPHAGDLHPYYANFKAGELADLSWMPPEVSRQWLVRKYAEVLGYRGIKRSDGVTIFDTEGLRNVLYQTPESPVVRLEWVKAEIEALSEIGRGRLEGAADDAVGRHASEWDWLTDAEKSRHAELQAERKALETEVMGTPAERVELFDTLSERGIEFETDEPIISLRSKLAPEAQPKGSIGWLDDGRAYMEALINPDLSTALHETGHLLLKQLDAPDKEIALRWYREEYKGEVDTTKDGWYFTGKDAEDFQEKFSQAFERYLTEGKAPTPSLAEVFKKIARWMLEIYHSLKGTKLDVKITDEMRDVFSRYVAGDPELRQEIGYFYEVRPLDSPAIEPVAAVDPQQPTLERWLFERKQGIEDAVKVTNPEERIQAINGALDLSNENAFVADWTKKVNDQTAFDGIARAEAELRAAEGIQEGVVGAGTAAHGADPTTSYQFRYRVVELESLIPSHKLGGDKNPKYPSSLQPRQRDRAASITQITQIAAELEPNAMLYHSQRIDDGSPIVGPDLLVESGNARVLALLKASRDYPENFQAYKNALNEAIYSDDVYGFPDTAAIEQMEQPVLVRERVTDVDSREAFVREANERATAGMTITENAASDAMLIPLESLGVLEIGENQSIQEALVSPRNKGFVRGFVERLPKNEHGTLVDDAGALSRAGQDRIVAALFARTFPGPEGERLLKLSFESLDVNVKRVVNGIEKSLGDLAPAEALIAEGSRPPELAIGEDLAVAAAKLQALRVEGMPVPDYLQQTAMFADLTDFQRVLLEFFYTSKSAKQISLPLKRYGQRIQALPDVDQIGMFGETKYPTKVELWELAGKDAQRKLFQLPDDAELGPIDGVPEPLHMASAQQEGWNNIQPVMNELEQRLSRGDGWAKKYKYGAIEAQLGDMKPQFDTWLDDITGDMASSKYASMKWGENVRDFALLDYSANTGMDNYMTVGIPYWFWPSQTLMKWAARTIDKPTLIANYFRLNRIRSLYHLPGFPTRLKGKVRVNLPWAPEWMGSMWVDPLRSWFPPDMFIKTAGYAMDEKERLEREAEHVIQTQIENGRIDRTMGLEAIRSHEGDVWDQARDLAIADSSSNFTGPLDYVGILGNFSLPIEYTRQARRGTPENIGPLPVTRMVKTLTGVNLEQPFRSALGLPDYDRFEDYRVQRMASNMAADGDADVNDVLQAYMTKQGPLWDDAESRVNQARLYGSYANPLYWIGFPADSMPSGEAKQRALGEEWKVAKEHYKQGDSQAFQKLLDEYPEYQARLALWSDPEQMLRYNLVDEIWTRYMQLPGPQKELVRMQLGEEFQTNFLEKPPPMEKRNYEAIPIPTLARWAQMVGYQLPELAKKKHGYDQPHTTEELQTEEIVNLLPPDVAEEVETYRDTRNDEFPNWYAVQSKYFTIPYGTGQRTAFMESTQEGKFLNEYWAWDAQYKEDHPFVGFYTERIEITDKQGNELASWSIPEILSNQPLMRQLLATRLYNDPLSAGALMELRRLWERMEQPGANFDHFVNSVSVSP